MSRSKFETWQAILQHPGSAYISRMVVCSRGIVTDGFFVEMEELLLRCTRFPMITAKGRNAYNCKSPLLAQRMDHREPRNPNDRMESMRSVGSTGSMESEIPGNRGSLEIP